MNYDTRRVPQEQKPLIVCFGEVLWDRFPDGPRLGGAPSNVAFHLGQLGARVALISRVGDDQSGRLALEILGSAGVDVSAVQIDPDHPTGAVDVTVHAGEPSYHLRHGSAWQYLDSDRRAAALAEQAAAICFGTLSQKRLETRAACDQVLAARPAHCPAVCDLNLRQSEQDASLVAWALSAADWLKLNLREETQLAAMLGMTDVTDELLAKHGVAEIALTRGESGCTMITAERSAPQAGFPAEPGGDNIGCGDAFTAVWVMQRLAGASLEDAARAACRYAAWVAGHRGATPSNPPPLF